MIAILKKGSIIPIKLFNDWSECGKWSYESLNVKEHDSSQYEVFEVKGFRKYLYTLYFYFTNNSLFCQHNYELVNQFEMLSEFDIVCANGKIPNTWNSQKRRIVTDYKCKKCNKIRRLQAVTPN